MEYPNYIHIKSNSSIEQERKLSLKYIINNVQNIENKNQAIDDLFHLTNDENTQVKVSAIRAFAKLVSIIPDKNVTWSHLLKLTNDDHIEVRREATRALGTAFSFIPDKEAAWKDLHNLTRVPEIEIKRGYASALGTAFSFIPDKEAAWQDLHRLTEDKSNLVRNTSVNNLRKLFPFIPDKEAAWQDLCALIQDPDVKVKRNAATSLGSAYYSVPNKGKAFNEIIELANNQYNYDNIEYIYYSLGRACIFNATNAKNEQDMKIELETAIKYFEKSLKKSGRSNPANFCLPFYRSFYSIIYKNETESRLEEQKYIQEAKKAIYNSKNKALLIKAVENLSLALKELRGLREKGLYQIRNDFKAYKKYCDTANELLDISEEETPIASKLIRNGIPILKTEIQISDKANSILIKTKDTPYEPFALETNNIAKQLSSESNIDDEQQESLSNKMIELAYKFCNRLSPRKRYDIIEEIEEAKKLDSYDKANKINKVMEKIEARLDPEIQIINISKRIKDVIRIAIIQFQFDLSEYSFPYKLANTSKDSTKLKILSTIKKAKANNADVICFPELCLSQDWLKEIQELSECLIIIPGSYYDTNNHNVCPIIVNKELVTPQLKIIPSDYEDSEIVGQGMTPGKYLNIYETMYGRFAILICRDFIKFHPKFEDIDIIFAVAHNEKNERYFDHANNHVKDYPSYVIISNVACYGGTSIFGQYHKNRFNILVKEGYKDRADMSLKLCSIKENKEGIIFADLDLKNKYLPMQTPLEQSINVKNIHVEKI